jgi:hypothetical protein
MLLVFSLGQCLLPNAGRQARLEAEAEHSEAEAVSRRLHAQRSAGRVVSGSQVQNAACPMPCTHSHYQGRRVRIAHRSYIGRY